MSSEKGALSGLALSLKGGKSRNVIFMKEFFCLMLKKQNQA
jgi:hypothetical protein